MFPFANVFPNVYPMFTQCLYVEWLLDAFWIVLELLVNQHTAEVNTHGNFNI